MLCVAASGLAADAEEAREEVNGGLPGMADNLRLLARRA
jgi:hypothetical protein